MNLDNFKVKKDSFSIKKLTPTNQSNFHESYFQNLQQKLILTSHKLSGYMGSSNPFKVVKVKSLNLNDDSSQIDSVQQKRFNESSSLSPQKKRFKLLDKYKQQKDEVIMKINLIKQNIAQKKQQNRSSASSGQNQRQNAYHYDFVLPTLPAKIQSNNGQKTKFQHKQLLKTPYQQKKLMTQTISTTSSISPPKLMTQIKLKEITQVKLIKKKQSEIKQSLQSFKILRPLGQGKFGSVSLAIHKESSLLCAIKKMPKYFQSLQITQQVIRQIKIQSFLSHPNICQLYTFFQQQNFIYLVLQLCYSGNVYSLLKKQGKFPQFQVRNIIRQVGNAVQYLHEHDIIHRDIKPQNIIFHQNVVKLCDFGWSVYSPLSRGTLCGTPIYASPELVQRKQYDGKIDIWNIGILTYQLLYGRVPFEIRCQEDLQKVITDQIYFPKSIQVTEMAKDFIRQCLNKNPQFRISIMKLLDHEFIYQKDAKK